MVTRPDRVSSAVVFAPPVVTASATGVTVTVKVRVVTTAAPPAVASSVTWTVMTAVPLAFATGVYDSVASPVVGLYPVTVTDGMRAALPLDAVTVTAWAD